jgi:hypothetical protein
MLIAETLLHETALARVKAALLLSGAIKHALQIQLSVDDELPSVSASTQIAMTPAGTYPGKNHKPSGGVWDLTFDIRFTVCIRNDGTARDDNRQTRSQLTEVLDQIMQQVDYSYELINAAGLLLVGTRAEGGRYVEPFRDFQIDPVAKPFYHDLFDSNQYPASQGADPIVGIRRGITFRQARFNKVRA